MHRRLYEAEENLMMPFIDSQIKKRPDSGSADGGKT